ncbi:hypothetical protein ACT3CD_02940 [Geofilum sp. OHC36d9]|uniref:hypothetical protein n=1 Tax=Geofilum sp. OHC36d9 TaxID=3458413 RepID=UPI0040349A06
MKKFISFEIQGATPLDYRYLHDEDFEHVLNENESFKYSNIYFFCKLKKRRFDLVNTKIINDFELIVSINIGEQNQKITTSIFNCISLIKGVPVNLQQTFDIRIDYNKSSPFILILLIKSDELELEEFEFGISITNVDHSLDFIEGNPPEIVYIGQSFRMLDRVREHKTLSKVISQLEDDEEIVIYFVNFKYGIGEKVRVNMKMWDFMLETENRTDKNYRDKISLAERFLIYLFKPKYNDQHINTELSKDTLVKKILLKSGITMIGLCYAMYGSLYQFWSPNQRLKADLISYDFDKPELGFQNEMDLFK